MSGSAFLKVGKFLEKKVNQKVYQATGVDVLRKYEQAAHLGDQLGVHHQGPQGHGTGTWSLNGPGIHVEPERSEEYPHPLISSIEEFLSQREHLGTTPYGGVALLLHALLTYVDPGTRALGQQMLVLCMWEESLVQGDTYKGWALSPAEVARLEAALKASGDCAVRSLVAGTKPEFGYYVDVKAVAPRFKTSKDPLPPTAMEAKVKLWSSGADAARTVTLRKNKKAIWKVVDYRELLGSVKPPTASPHSAADVL